MSLNHHHRDGFTFLELVVVISVIAALAAMGFPAYKFIKRQVDIGATETLVNAVSAAISIYPLKTWGWRDAGGQDHVAYMWDLNQANGPDIPIDPKNPGGPKRFDAIDGRPCVGASDATHDGGFTADVVASGYTGFYDMTQPSINKRFVSKRHQVLDAWGQPLRIAFASNTYGASWFGVWSAGPNMIDSTIRVSGVDMDVLPGGSTVPSDDLTSWTRYGGN